MPLRDLAVEGERITRRQSIRKPMRLDPVFELRVAGDESSGTSRAGRLPASRVAGRRREAP